MKAMDMYHRLSAVVWRALAPHLSVLHAMLPHHPFTHLRASEHDLTHDPTAT